MSRYKVAICLASKPNFDSTAFKYFLLSANQLQSHYEFVFPDIDGYPLNKSSYSSDELCKYTEVAISIKNLKADYFIFVITSKITGNYFSTSYSNISTITTEGWERHFAPPSLFEYLIKSIVCCLLVMDPKTNLSFHDEVRGCLFDYNRIKSNCRAGVALGYICDEDAEIIEVAYGQSFLSEINNILGHKWIGSLAEVGSIAHNLLHTFHFNIEKDSGFNKTYWQKSKEKLADLPTEFIKILLTAIIASLATIVLIKFGFKTI